MPTFNKQQYEVGINYNLAVNTKEAIKSFGQLSETLKKSLSEANFGKGLSRVLQSELQEANRVVGNLRSNLEQAFNVKTGTLNFTEFTKGMQNSGYEIKDYVASLNRLGPAGDQAFQQLAHAVLNSEIQLKRAHPILNKFIDSLGRVALYQFSTKALSLFTQGIRDAYQFTQDLNRSLNEIRIVTKMSTDDMASFALKANEAAQALSSTTTAYTDASLIYFQQGLSEEEAIERTNVTLKMANVTGESVKTISNDLTAIWNNFDDGSKNLEYYADVMAKLGATTASSSREIATGLEKFAPIAQAVGLSYEYAASALATVSAETRASADVVGTAFKTIFARLESLKLGETLEDGVGLTKYTSAVESIGVSIMGTNGEMRKLDDILKDIGAKWQELDSAQKSALANTVAGVRQYSQFMALMENWDKIEMNVDVSLGSEGELQEQQEIYAESWEGASKRVKDTLQSIYMMLLNDDSFIELTNGLNEILKVLGNIIKGVGGLPGILATVANLVLTIKNDVIATRLGEGLQNMWLRTKQGREYQANQRNEIINAYAQKQDERLFDAGFLPDDSDKAAINRPKEVLEEQLELKRQLAAQNKELSAAQQDRLKYELEYAETLADEKVKLSSQKEALTAVVELSKTRLERDGSGAGVEDGAFYARYSLLDMADSFSKREDFSNMIDFNQMKTSFANGLKEIEAIFGSEAVSKIKTEFNKILEIDPAKAQKSKDEIIKIFQDITKEINRDNIFELKVNDAQAKEKVGKLVDSYTENSRSNTILNSIKTGLQEAFNSDVDYDKLLKTNEFQSSLDTMKASIKMLLGDDLEEISEKAKQAIQGIFSATTTDDFKTAIEVFNTALDQTDDLAHGAEIALRDLTDDDESVDRLAEGVKNINLNLRDQISLTNKLHGSRKANEEAHKKMLSSSLDSYKQLGQQIANTARALTSITQAYNAIKSLISAINDEDMSFGDKMGAILGSIGSLAMTATSMITMFTGSMKAAGAAGAAAAPGMTAFGTATTTAMGPVGIAIVALGSLVAILTGVSMALQAAAPETYASRLKSLNEAVDQAHQKFDTASKTLEEFSSKLKNLEDGVTSMNLLVKGSQAYTEALKENLKYQNDFFNGSNKDAINYVRANADKYGLEADDFLTDENGLYSNAYLKAIEQRIAEVAASARTSELIAEQQLIDFNQGNALDRIMVQFSSALEGNKYGKSKTLQQDIYNVLKSHYDEATDTVDVEAALNELQSMLGMDRVWSFFDVTGKMIKYGLDIGSVASLQSIFTDLNSVLDRDENSGEIRVRQLDETFYAEERYLLSSLISAFNDNNKKYVNENLINTNKRQIGSFPKENLTGLLGKESDIVKNWEEYTQLQRDAYTQEIISAATEISESMITDNISGTLTQEARDKIIPWLKNLQEKGFNIGIKAIEDVKKLTLSGNTLKYDGKKLEVSFLDFLTSNNGLIDQVQSSVKDGLNLEGFSSDIQDILNKIYTTGSMSSLTGKELEILKTRLNWEWLRKHGEERYGNLLDWNNIADELQNIITDNPNIVGSNLSLDIMNTLQQIGGEALVEQYNNLTEEEIEALSKLQGRNLTAKNNIELLAKQGYKVQRGSALESLLNSMAGDYTTYEQDYMQYENIYNSIVEKLTSGEELTAEEYGLLQLIGISPNAFALSFNKKGEAVYSVYEDAQQKILDRINSIRAGGMNYQYGQETNNNQTLTTIQRENISRSLATSYSAAGTNLTKLAQIYNNFNKTLTNTEAREVNLIAYTNAMKQVIRKSIDELGISLEQYNKIKNDLNLTDQEAIIYLNFRANFDKLKEDFNNWKKSNFSDYNKESSLYTQLSNIFEISEGELRRLIPPEDSRELLEQLFSEDTTVANEACKRIQDVINKYKFKATINLSIDDTAVSEAITNLLEETQAKYPNLSITAILNTKEFIDGLNSLIRSGLVTAEQFQAALASIGVEPKTKRVPILAPSKKRKISGDVVDLQETYDVKYVDVFVGFKASEFEIPQRPNDNTTSSMYEQQRQDTGLRFQSLKKEIEDLNDEADDLRKKLNLDISLNLPEDETKYEGILEKRIDLYEQLKEASEEYLKSDKENAIKAYNELNNALGGGLANLFEDDKFNKEEFERSYIDLMNSNFEGATKESADAVEKLKEEVDYYTDSWEAAANQQKETTKALKEARQELEKWQRFDKVLDRYNTEQRLFNAQLADEENRMKNINREMQRQEQLASQSTGPQKIAYLDKTIDYLHKQTEELREQDEINKRSINNIVEELTGLNKSYDLRIDLTNLANNRLMKEEEVYKILRDQFEAMYGQTESSEEINALVEEYLKKIKEANDLIQKMADNQSTIWGYEAQEQAKNYEKLVEKLNAQLTKTKNELTLISYDFSTLSSNFYTMGEAAALFGQQGEQYIENLEAYKDHLGSLKQAYEDTKISQTDYVQGLQQVFDGIMENLNSIEQLDQQVKSYYGQTLQAASAELSAHTAGIARATATLNHYLSVMQMINRQTDYASLGKVYEGLVKTTKNEYDVAVANYEMLKKQEENARQLLEQYSGDKTSKSFEIANQTWQDAAAAMDQAYSDMLSKMEAWTQAIVDNFQNTIHKLQQTLENELTDGTNFDTLITQIERLKTADDEYLTRTNQIYELNKLAREAQKQMDEQVNSVSKQRLGQFINETNALKDRNKFSNLELEIQRARYELLLAEMAVEDARNNKNKVRLQRDSEGGYGYVYTAEADDVSDAVQKYEDAQNRLYNIGLENADNYTNKRVQTAKEWFDTMVQIEEDYQNGTIESEEEYRNRQDEATQYYYQRLQNYAELYQIALHETDENVILDSWTTHTTIEGHTEKWKNAMDKYVGEVREEWDKYRRDLTYANEEVGRTAEETEGKVKLLTTASQELTDQILSQGGLISALDTQLGAVLEQVGAYTDWRNSIRDVITEMKNLAKLTAKDINDQNGVGGSPSAAEYGGQDISRLMAANQLRRYELENLGRDLTAEESDEYTSLIKEYFNLTAARNEKMKSSQYANELTTEQVESIIQKLLLDQDISMLKELAQTGGKLFDSLKSIVGLDTGGYTGEWSNDGRLAFLHQRELVLNAEDTQNILSAVGMVRQMDSLLEGFTFGQGLTPGTMQQQVTIHAEFPNVQDHNEIELAFNDLVNRASQYIMAK